MKKIDLGQTIGILANIGVIAGIVFLGVELQQNNELLEAEARADRRDIAREAVQRVRENADLRDAILKALSGEPLTEEELFLIDLENRSALIDFQYIYLEYEQRLLSYEEIPIDAWRRLYQGESPGMREYWEMHKISFRPEFIQWMDENIVNER